MCEKTHGYDKIRVLLRPEWPLFQKYALLDVTDSGLMEGLLTSGYDNIRVSLYTLFFFVDIGRPIARTPA